MNSKGIDKTQQSRLISLKAVEYLEDSLLIYGKILVISDLHLGYEEKYGEVLYPKVQIKETKEKLNRVFLVLKEKKIKIEKIIILGDLKHEFGKIVDCEWRGCLELLDFIMKNCNETILIKGNHDNILGPITKKRNLELVDYYEYKDFCFLHGHKLFNKVSATKNLVLGHLHPAITLSDNYKSEKYKCFLKGNWNKKQIYILPGFSNLSTGHDLTTEHYIKRKNYSFFIVPEK